MFSLVEVNENGCEQHLTEEECRAFATNHADYGWGNPTSSTLLFGCLLNVNNNLAYFNSYTAGSDNDPNYKPVCKTTELVEGAPVRNRCETGNLG